MKYKTTVCLAAAGLMAVMPLAPASAHENWGHGGGHWGRGGGPLVGLFALGAAVAVGTAAILAAPVNALAAQPAYYPPPQPYYAQPAYYARPAYYAPQPAYYAQAPVYYAAPSGYYYGQ